MDAVVAAFPAEATTLSAFFRPAAVAVARLSNCCCSMPHQASADPTPGRTDDTEAVPDSGAAEENVDDDAENDEDDVPPDRGEGASDACLILA